MTPRDLRENDPVPGTEIMTKEVSDTEVCPQSPKMLVPRPSDDLNDPLNWSPLWKGLVLINQGLFVTISVIPALSVAPMTPIYMEAWGKSYTQVSLLTGVTVLALGYCNFIIVPCCEIFGRRPTLFICALINLASCIWSATASSYGSFLGARILAGTGAAANESVMNTVVADIFFIHERGKYIGSYFWCYFVGGFIGPIISGAIADASSWRTFFWACTGAQALSIIGLALLFPETRRLGYNASSPSPEAPASSTTARLEIVEIKPQSAHRDRIQSQPAESEVLDIPLRREGKPSAAQFNFFQKIDQKAWKSAPRHFFAPAYIFSFPIIFWAAMTMGASSNCLLVVNILQSAGLSAPPYNFTPAQVGYANFALFGGGLIGLLSAGPWSDWYLRRATISNQGVREPEKRLVCLLPWALAAVVGLTVFGVGLQERIPWPTVVIVGFGLVGVQVVAIPTIAIAYAIDCYRPLAGEIMAIATVCKNTFGFGMTFFIPDWTARDGFIPPVMLMMVMAVGFTVLGSGVFSFYGKTCRRWTRNSKFHEF